MGLMLGSGATLGIFAGALVPCVWLSVVLVVAINRNGEDA
jgi:hypothetical protein